MSERPLAGWLWLVAVLATLNYAGRAASGRPEKDVLYTWGAAVNGAVLLGVVLVVVLVLARRRPRDLLALRAPSSWAVALGVAVTVLIGISILSGALEPLLHPGREQGLTPSEWDSSRAVPFAVNVAVVALLAPVVEELTFRGLGYSVLEPFGRWAAILGVGLAFGLAHGLLQALPLLVAFGSGLAYLRSRTDSVYPGMILHSLFNAAALAISVST